MQENNPLQSTEPGQELSASSLGCSVQPAWLAQPVQPFEFFDIRKPHFYLIHDTPMAFAMEVTHD